MRESVYKIGEFAELLNVSTRTLRRWDEKGILVAKRTGTNHRFYTHEQYLEFISDKKEVVYLSKNQSLLTDSELSNLVRNLKKGKTTPIIIKDTSEEDGFQREKWGQLLEDCLGEKISAIYVYNEEDLPRNGLECYKKILERLNAEVKVLEMKGDEQ